MKLRVSAGKFKNRKILSHPGKGLRPLSGRIKEAYFSIMSGRIKDALFLDLFAGTGNVGIEALSRGAEKAVFVDKNPSSVELIRKNIEAFGLECLSEVFPMDVFDFIPKETPDVIFAGPPYKDDISSDILKHCLDNRLLKDGAVLTIQHHYKEPLDYSGLIKTDSRKYGITVLDFFKKE